MPYLFSHSSSKTYRWVVPLNIKWSLRDQLTISQTLIVLSTDPDTILVPSGENATDRIGRLWAFVFSLNSPSASIRQANRRQFWPRRGVFEDSGAPEFQTLIVLSRDPETILVPSGENATELMQWLWAFVFSLNSPSAPARQTSRRQFWPRRRDFEGVWRRT